MEDRDIIQRLHDLELLVYNYMPKQIHNYCIKTIQEAQLEIVKHAQDLAKER